MGLGDYFNQWAKDFMVKKTWRFGWTGYKNKEEDQKRIANLVRERNDRTPPDGIFVQETDSPIDPQKKGRKGGKHARKNKT